MNNTAAATLAQLEDNMDNVIDAWHAAGRPGPIEEFDGYVTSRDAYLAVRWS